MGLAASGPRSTELDRVGVSIVTHQSDDVIADAILTLPHDALARIVVVDNASSDATINVVDALGLQNLHLVRQGNVGFGAGHNRGVEACGDVDLVLLLNPDARLDEANLKALIHHMDGNDGCAVVAPCIVDADGGRQHSSGNLPTLWTELKWIAPRRLGVKIPDRRHPPGFSSTGPVPVVEGACMLVRRQAFRAVEGFDPRYFLFFEEMVLAGKIESLGMTVDLCAEAQAVHLGGTSRGRAPDRGYAAYYESTTRYLRDRRTLRTAIGYVAFSWATWGFHALLGARTPREALAFARAATRGLRSPKTGLQR